MVPKFEKTLPKKIDSEALSGPINSPLRPKALNPKFIKDPEAELDKVRMSGHENTEKTEEVDPVEQIKAELEATMKMIKEAEASLDQSNAHRAKLINYHMRKL